METLLKPAEVCKILGINDRMLAKWRQEGINLKYYKMGSRTIRYSPAEVDSFIKRNASNV